MAPAPAIPIPPGLASCRALWAYDAEARATVLGLKRRDERARVPALADALAPLVPDVPGLVVTWAPTGAARRRGRGFDQAELLARAVARRRDLPVRRLLRRRPGPAQAGRAAGERWGNPSFAARRTARPVLVVDDVTTTGATLAAAGAALVAAGAPAVHGLVVAYAPARAARAAGE